MPASILEDSLERPELFHWFGVIESDFDRWLHELPFRVHPGLVTFWRRTGGGDVFESETLLGPLHPDESENVLKLTEFHWNRGLPSHLVLFHVGSFYSASNANKPRHGPLLVTMKPGSYEIEKTYGTFHQWYSDALRAEFRGRYGLRPD
jgi:hypothetical protein